jgi:exosortase
MNVLTKLRPDRPTSQRRSLLLDPSQPLWVFLVVGLATIGLYFPVEKKLIYDWWVNPNYSHGFLIPLFVGFVLWERRERLSATRVQPTWFGLVIFSGSLVMLIVGVLGAEIFLSRVSFLMQIAGLVLLFWGWHWFRLLVFPWALLWLAVPIPAIIFNQITLPLQLFASTVAASLLPICGVPVLQDGNIIQLPATTLEVVTACSGIRSLVSLISLAIFYGYIRRRTTSGRWILVVLSVPIAVGVNSLRVVGTGLLAQYWGPDKAEGFFHTFAGLIVFVLSMGLLILGDLLVLRVGKTSYRPS